MRATTVRFGDDLWDMLEREASLQGISVAQLVRDAAILRVAYLSGKRGDLDVQQSLAELARGGGAREEVDEAEQRRLEALRRTNLLDSPREEAFDRLTRLAAQMLEAPAALVSLVDEKRQFFKSDVGLQQPWSTLRETPLSHSFCKVAVRDRVPLVVPDAREHPELKDNLAVRDMDVVAYAGIPLITRTGDALGSLCVLDTQPRDWTGEQIAALGDLAALALDEIESRA